MPVPLEPTELSGRERVALALAKTDFRDRCYKRSPSRADERAAERDIATFSRLAARWPPLWDDLGFVMTEPEGGWGDLSPPSAAPYFDVDFCRLPEALQLLRNELPVGEDNVFEH